MSRNRIFMACLAMGLATATAQTSAVAYDWAELGLSPTRSRVSLETSGPDFSAGGWAYSVPATQDAVYRALIASPAIGDGFVIIGTSDRKIRALRERDGRQVWEVSVGDAVQSSPAIHNGVVYAASLDRHLYALRIESGVRSWSRDLGGIAYASPAIADGSVFVAAGNPTPRVFRLDPVTGDVQWVAGEGVLQQATQASVAVAGGHVLIGEVQGRVHSFAVATGRYEWTYQAAGNVNLSSPLVIGDRVYLLPGGNDSRLHAMELSTGAAVAGWPIDIAVPEDAIAGTRLMNDRVVSSPAGRDNRIVFDLRVDQQVDTDLDGIGETWLLREFTVAVDPAAASVAWMVPNGRTTTADPNQIPTLGLCPTPAIYQAARGRQALVATASTLSPRVRVLDLGKGTEQWAMNVSAPTRGSPAMANGRLFVVTDAGTVHSLLSASNQPPEPPTAGFFPSSNQVIDADSIQLRWRPAFDAEGDPLIYQVRFDSDGEILASWAGEITTAPQHTSARVGRSLRPDETYTYAIRSRDSHGAWSPWSEAQHFRTSSAPPVSVGGTSYPGLTAALAAARAGDTVTMGAGTYHLSGPIRVSAGVSLAGAGPHLTMVDATGLATGVSVEGSSSQPVRIAGFSVGRAGSGIQIRDAREVELRNVIVRDSAEVGVEIGVNGTAHLINLTIFNNAGVGVQAYGETEIRNTLVTGNGTGVAASDPSLVVSHYNDVFGNPKSDLDNVSAGVGDLNRLVQFQTQLQPQFQSQLQMGDGQDLRLRPEQATTDQGDPSDRYDLEPLPNGGRINIGAFGNTPLAELSASPPPSSTEGPAPAPAPAPGGASGPAGPSEGSGPSTRETSPAGATCSAAPISGTRWPASGLLVALAMLALRLRRSSRDLAGPRRHR